MILHLLVTLVVVLCTYNYLKRWTRMHKMAEKIGGPKGYPFFGHALLFLRKEFLSAMLEVDKMYFGIARFWIGHKLVISINSPELFEEFLKNNNSLDKGEFYKFMEPLFGNGLIASDCQVWSKNKKVVAPTLNALKIKSYVSVFVDAANKLADRWIDRTKEPFEPYNDVSLTTFGIIMSTALGTATQYDDHQATEMVNSIKNISAGIAYRFIRPWLYSNIVFNLTPIGKQVKNNTTTFRNFLKKMISSKVELCEPSFAEDDGFINHLLATMRSNSNFTEGDVLDELSTYITAGFETTSTAISFVLVMLGCHPEIQVNVFQEQEDVNVKCLPDWEAINKMEYLEMFIKETLRLFPVITIIGREIAEDTKVGDYLLPKGASVIIPIYAIHRNSLIWSNPLKFDPERFTGSSEKFKNSSAFLPFGGGPRICIGQRFAMISMKAIVSAIIRRYQIIVNYSVDDIRISKNVTLDTKGLKILLRRRETDNIIS